MDDPRSSAELLDEAREALAANKLRKVERICLFVLERGDADREALILLGRQSLALGHFRKAASHLDRCLTYSPDDVEALELRARVAIAQGRGGEARLWIDRAIEHAPDSIELRTRAAYVNDRAGLYAEAEAVLAPLVARGEEAPGILAARCNVALHSGDLEQAVELADRIADREDVDPYIRRQVGFQRGNALDQLGEFDRAFESWRLANELVRMPHDQDAFERGAEQAIEFFTSDTLRELAHAPLRSPLPAFIAGLPRTGTTLIEQVIDAHPAAHGAGEPTDLERLTPMLPSLLHSFAPFPQCLRQLTPEIAQQLATRYLKHIRHIGGELAECVVNKSLDNFKYVGLIELLFPGAPIIRCRRDPMDTGLSMFASPLNPNQYPFASSLSEIGAFMRVGQRLLDHWAEVSELPLLEITYEDMVADLEPNARRIIEFCRLRWDDRCLRFHESGRTVKSLAYFNVAQPIYTSSVGRHKRYEGHLDELRAALA